MKRNSNRVPLKIAEKRKQIEGGFMIHAKEVSHINNIYI